MGVDDLQRVAVGPRLVQSRRPRRVRRAHPVPGQPRRGGPAAGRDRLPLEADGHDLSERAGGPRGHPGARTLARIACPALAFKAEAIVAPHDLVQYLGAGRHYGKVSDLAYHNTLMVQIWSMLATADSRLAVHTLERLPRAPSSASWITYVRCHDDIGWAITDDDTTGVGLSGYHHRRFLSDWYSGLYPGSTARGLVFQENPATGDRRISGTTAALTGLSAAWSARRGRPAIGRFFLTHAIVYAWGGIPVIWSGDELAMANDPGWAAEEGLETGQPVGTPAQAGLAARRAAPRPADRRRTGVQRVDAPR